MAIDVAADIVIGQRARYEKLWASLSARQRRLVDRMLADLEAEVLGAKRGSWSEAQAASVLAQVASSVKGLSEKQLALLRRALPGVAKQSQFDLAQYLGKLDAKFGTARPLRWDTLEWLEGYSRPLLRSRLRIYQRSFARYGAAAVSDIEEAVARAATLGQPWTEVRDDVWSAVRGVVGDRQWMVDRIVRTETSTVYSSTALAAMIEEDDAEDDPMQKKLVAVFDKVTGADSKALHGQTVGVRELFTDRVRGTKFDAPPNRPHDRELIVAWRKSWGSDADFNEDTANDVGAEGTAG
jgi:hypothetical protein